MKDAHRSLERHFRHWRDKGLLSPDLERRLREASAELDRGRVAATARMALAFLGGALVLAGLVLILAENWELLPRGVKLGGWALLHVVFLGGAHHLERRWPDASYLHETLVFVSGGWVMAGIALVSQIYHLNARPPNGVWLWLLLLLPMTWLTKWRAVSLLLFTSLVAAAFLELGEPTSWIHADPWAESPWLWLAVPLLSAFLVSWLPYRLKTLPTWIGVWIFGAGQLFLLVLGTVQELDTSVLGHAWWLAITGVLTALAFPGRCLPRAWRATTSRLVLSATLLPWILLGSDYDRGVILDELAIGLSWALQLAIAVLVIREGAHAGSTLWVNLGYLAMLCGVLARYFDFFGHYLEGGAALALTGLLVLLVLYALERARRSTLARESP